MCIDMFWVQILLDVIFYHNDSSGIEIFNLQKTASMPKQSRRIAWKPASIIARVD